MALEVVVRKIAKSALALVVGLAVWLSFPKAFADRFNTETASSVRALGMGNAAINTERGAYAVFYNPANIAAKDTKTTIQLVNIKANLSEGYMGGMSSLSAVNITSLSGLYSGMRNSPDKFVGGGYSVFPNITLRNLSLGMLYEVDQGGLYRSMDGAVRVKARDRFAPTAALSFRLFGGVLRFGAAVQYLTLGNADTVIRGPVTNGGGLDFKDYIASGSGLSNSGGLTLTLPFRYLPSFSVVGRNIGDPSFSGKPSVKFGEAATPGAGQTLQQRMTFDAAAAFTVYLGTRMEMKWEADYRDISNKLQGGLSRHLFMGTELVFYDLFRIRAGLAHGYPSGGIGIGNDKTSLEVAVYSDELNDRYRSAKDTRFVLQYSFGIFK